MILSGTFTFEGPRARVWEILQDPDVLAKALPGTKTLTKVGEDRYQGVMKVSVGPVNAAEFAIDVELKDKVEPEKFAMVIDGKGGVGFTKGTATIALEEQPGPVTVMTYTSDVQIGGKIAAVGQRLLESVGKMMTKQALEALNKELKQVEVIVMKGAAAAREEPPRLRMKPAPFEYFRPQIARRSAVAARRARRRREAARGRAEPHPGDELQACDAVGAGRSERAAPSSATSRTARATLRIGGMTRQRAVERSTLVVRARAAHRRNDAAHRASGDSQSRHDRRQPRARRSGRRAAGRDAGAERDA